MCIRDRWFVDPDVAADLGRLGSVGEAFGMLLEGSVQGDGAGVIDLAVGAVMDRCGCVPADPRVVVDVIIFGEEPVTKDPGFGQRIEVMREIMDVLQRLVRYAGDRLPRSW